MSYAPIYSKLRELEERLAVVETTKVVSATQPTVATAVTTDFDISGIRKEIDDLLKLVSTFATKAELPDVSAFATNTTNNDVSSLATFATKEELPDVSAFATKAELPDVSAFATKAELPDVSGFATLDTLAGFATKDELVAYAELSAKFDNLLNVVSHLNNKITEANEKIAELEARP